MTLQFRQHFFNLKDPRRADRSPYRFLDLLFIAIAATVAGAQDFGQIAVFACKRKGWLAKFCQLPSDGQGELRTPCHDTFERLFKRLNPRHFGRCLASWTAALAGGLGLKHVAIDGKTLRGSSRTSEGLCALHLVSAWATENQLSLGCVAVEEKSNEITAIPQLLRLLELEGALVTIDAMGTQKAIATQIVEQKGDYVLPVKGNQEGLWQDIRQLFDRVVEKDFEGVRFDQYEVEEKGHGRLERREYMVLYEPEGMHRKDEWAGLSVVGLCMRERLVAGKRSYEEHYFIGSRDMPAKAYGEALREHWGVENNCHWTLDVTFREDHSQLADRNAAMNLGLIRRLALSLVKRHQGKGSVASKRYAAALDTSLLQEILGVGWSGRFVLRSPWGPPCH
jgi:predicted transposase YbfD/YdcC